MKILVSFKVMSKKFRGYYATMTETDDFEASVARDIQAKRRAYADWVQQLAQVQAIGGSPDPDTFYRNIKGNCAGMAITCGVSQNDQFRDLLTIAIRSRDRNFDTRSHNLFTKILNDFLVARCFLNFRTSAGSIRKLYDGFRF